MIKFSEKFTSFVLSTLKVLVGILIIASFITLIGRLLNSNMSIILVAFIYLFNIAFGYYIINSKLSNNIKISIIIIQGIILRVLWVFNVNTQLASDFNTMYQSATQLINGDNSMFVGTAYIARFPHLTGMVLYMALMQIIFASNTITAIKIINVVLGIIVVFLIYLIINSLFDNRKYSLYGGLIATVYPSLISYTTVLCSENIAMPFYLLSLFLFIKYIKFDKNKISLLIASGIILAIGNIFRSVAVIMLIAYIIYSIVYFNVHLKSKLKVISSLIISYIMVMIIVSSTLQVMNITEYPLWRGSEPSITNVLKGTNILSGGRWNSEDASLPEECNFDYDLITKRSKEIILDRLTGTNPWILLVFYLTKFSLQWNEGDFAGVFWAQYNLDSSNMSIDFSKGGTGIMQLFYIALLILMLVGLYNRKRIEKNKEIILIYIILCGFGLSYLITESQGRYSYICSFIFVILPIVGIDYLENKFLERRKRINEKD